MTSYLNVLYIGQVGTGANEHGNDCGAACAAMIIKFAGLPVPTVDALYNEINPINDKYLSVGGVMGALLSRGIDCDWDAGVSTERLRQIVNDGNPCIALIKYGDLSKIRPNTFKGSHFVVVIGVDDSTVTINDPLNTPTSGEGVKIPRAMWDDCWTGLDDGNPDRGLIIVNMAGMSQVEEWASIASDHAIRTLPFTNKTGSQVLKRVQPGEPLHVKRILAIWAETTDGRCVALRYDGEDLARKL